MNRRPPGMMKVRLFLQSFPVIWVLTFGASCNSLEQRQPEPLQVYEAAIHRDCAPWDGPAFRVSIQYESEAVLHIFIWEPPDFARAVRFEFPDETGRLGEAVRFPKFGEMQTLSGSVVFQRVERGNPVVGRFDLFTETGQRLQGEFHAEWVDEVVYCG